MIQDLWYKQAVIYCLDVEKFLDLDGDGVGDFPGLERRLDYLAGLGVTCLWLQPFYPSPNRDNGYDVADYYGVHPKHGTSGDFVDFMAKANQLGLRVLVDLVVSHTSVEHPWFQAARRDPRSPYRPYYVWSRSRPADHADGVVFPGHQKTTWTRDAAAGQYYFHRFYEFQPDLDTQHPPVREEILRIMGYWLQLGVSGFRLDAVPFLIEHKGAGVKPAKDFTLLSDMSAFMQWRRGDGVLLAEANVPAAESQRYFGPRGERLQMMLNFPVNQNLFLTLATGDARPLARALEATRDKPPSAQWVNFLRSHDELDLGRLTDAQREAVFSAFAPRKRMQLYHRGIRRRLAPMLDNDRRRLEQAFSLLFSLPGTPMLQFGDEIGLGDDLSLPQREAARTPMQWSDEAQGGFTTSDRPVRPVIDDPVYGYHQVNVAAQRRDRQSLLSWMAHALRVRRECAEIGWGTWRLFPADEVSVLILRYEWRGRALLAVHNFAPRPAVAVVTARAAGHRRLVNVLSESTTTGAQDADRHVLRLPPYGYRWYKVGGTDHLGPIEGGSTRGAAPGSR